MTGTRRTCAEALLQVPIDAVLVSSGLEGATGTFTGPFRSDGGHAPTGTTPSV
ncbi:hypothetical protein SNOG_15211 [Parastagonospora nodorum SN15]|uniref:Uncharacterized protein n=1 Tax=Phaeosphaeria nodorum (strain SN15 / ATCC MYA-4574 / FGSC 10173) TaxID=321614 RepID=Q0TZ80_PHANO|nr:hypothetical protein SNOG_15211 [Parastagonospora nodorum SN15]EAT77436.1 hypothetical protein SNOG_15211 [Parastagonospora nodorum SN15]